ncbi:putative cytochrome P450 alkane hydroxylase [Durotheca rogersii]|uniref:putative cytochrome P450 alkane hydroxylase n=1 Tax=Durotheca rogersii TaxID=419775 RepID=UPI002221272E|nr:putative cytochrome P450 alkane hydroxylase [Durotheca rogersii]KAI5859950.1 putative cytochrome P450 alkane hydroxylase [Durotheca rogersii]
MAFALPLAASGLVVFSLYYLLQWLTLYRRRSHMKRENGCLPPKKLAQMDPFLGTDVVFQNLRAAKKFGFLNLLRSRHAANGLTFTTNTYFRTTINTCDPTLIQNVLSFQFQDFGMGPLRRNSASPLLGQGIFTTDDEIWAHQRALIRPSFVRAQVTDFSIFGHHVDQLIALIARRNYIVDLQQLFFRMVLDSNSEYMFGESVGLMSENASESATKFHHALDYAQQGTILRLRLGNLMFTHRDQKFRDSCRTVHAYADKFVGQALEYRRSQALLPPEKREKEDGVRQKYVFLNELAKDTEDPILLRDQIVNMLLAARDTTAGLLAFVFFILARRPDIWAKLREDVLDHYCEPLTYEAIMDMKYLRFVVHEALRLFPPIATNSRMANKDTVLPVGGGPDGKSPLFVKKNNVVTYSTFVMHRRKEFFGEDADEFRPERWENLRPGWEFLPFNGGPRICPGQKFALTESSYTIARLLHAFSSIENLDPTDWREQLTLSLTLNNGVQCRLTPAA